ncbi:hypothetical protein ACTQ45_06305 [Fundicoccus sp. Sow4_D5]|uniref:hypothetical protein n=1 Tax=Fundicoccus sp. Sow4_D5 TaxID=3438782 RepID=UPI003F8ED490
MGKGNFFSKYVYDAPSREAGLNISWASIFAGFVTFIATSLMFSLVGASIGFGAPDLTAANPLKGVGMGLVIWIIFALVVSLGLAGYVAGLTASRAGFVHGFLTWAVSLIAMFFLMTSTATSAFNAVGSLVGVTGDAVGTTLATAGDAVGNLSEEAFQTISENVNVDLSTMDLEQDVVDALENSDIEQLQPEYLQGQLDATVNEISDAGKRIVVDGEDPAQVFDEVTTSIQERVEGLAAEIDEEDLTQAIADNSDLTEQEVEEAVQNIQEGYPAATEEAKQMLAEAETAIAELRADAEQAIEDARIQAEEIANATARYSLYVFFGMLIALVISSFAGFAGAKTFQAQVDTAK